MKKGINLFWIVFVILHISIVMISLLDCVRFVPTHYVGLPIMEDGLYSGFNGPITLPEPSYRNFFNPMWKLSVIAIVLFFLKYKVLHILGNIVTLLQVTIVYHSKDIAALFDTMSNGIGELRGYEELTVVAYILLAMTFISFLFSIFLTVFIRKDEKITRV